MSMISPESFIDKLQNKSYKALTKERDRLIKEIQNFEKMKKQ